MITKADDSSHQILGQFRVQNRGKTTQSSPLDVPTKGTPYLRVAHLFHQCPNLQKDFIIQKPSVDHSLPKEILRNLADKTKQRPSQQNLFPSSFTNAV